MIDAVDMVSSTIPLSGIQRMLIRIGALILIAMLLCYRKDDLLLKIGQMEAVEVQYQTKNVMNYERYTPEMFPKINSILEIFDVRHAMNMEELTLEMKNRIEEGTEHLKELDAIRSENLSVTADEEILDELGEIKENVGFGYLEETGPREEAGKSDGLGEGEQEKEPDRTVPKVDIGEPFQTVVGDKPNPPDETIEEEKPGDSDQTVEGEKPAPYPITKGGFLIDEEQMIVGIDVATFAVEDGYLELPAEDCVGIRRNAFASCTEGIVEIWISENITVIESGAFCDIPELEWLEVSSAHPVYTSVAGVVYDREVSTLNVFPGARTGTFEVPGTVRRMESFAMDHTSLSGLDMRKCGEMELAPELFGDGTGEGIRVMVDGEWEEYYRNLFAPYSVEILGYHH